MITDEQARQLKAEFRGRVDTVIYSTKSLFRAFKTSRDNVILPPAAQAKLLKELENLKK